VESVPSVYKCTETENYSRCPASSTLKLLQVPRFLNAQTIIISGVELATEQAIVIRPGLAGFPASGQEATETIDLSAQIFKVMQRNRFQGLRSAW
jgi:hypothetical protein